MAWCHLRIGNDWKTDTFLNRNEYFKEHATTTDYVISSCYMFSLNNLNPTVQLSLILHYLLVLCSDRERGWWFHIWPPVMFILLKILPCQRRSNFMNFNCCAVFMDVKYSVVLVTAGALSPVCIRSLACIMPTVQDLRIYLSGALPSCMSMYYVCQRYISCGTVMAWSIFCRTCAIVCELNACLNSSLFFAMVEPKLCYMHIGPRYGDVCVIV